VYFHVAGLVLIRTRNPIFQIIATEDFNYYGNSITLPKGFFAIHALEIMRDDLLLMLDYGIFLRIYCQWIPMGQVSAINFSIWKVR